MRCRTRTSPRSTRLPPANARKPSARERCSRADGFRVALLAHEHRDGLALEVDVGFAADVDGYPLDGAAGEAPRHHARIVVRDAGATVTADTEPLAADHELA